MKQGLTKEWHKYWWVLIFWWKWISVKLDEKYKNVFSWKILLCFFRFVLQDVALLYYRDPKAESKGFLDGIIDLSLVQHVEKTELPRNFGFSVHTFEGKSIIFSAITDGIRNNWITSLRKAANLPSTSSDDSSSAGIFNIFLISWLFWKN